VGRQLYFDGSEVDASGGFTLIVPDGELWRINWIAVDWITNTGSSTRYFLLQCYDFLGTGFGYYVTGAVKPGDNSGGSVTWMPGVVSHAVTAQLIQEPLPRPLFAYSTWRIQVQIGNAGTDFLNSLRADIERWLVVAAPTTGAPGGGGNTGGGGIQPPYFIEG
jgi:hypothetical protein